MQRHLLLVVVSLLALGGVSLVAQPADAGELQIEFHGAGQHAYDPSFDPFGRGDTPNVFFSGNLGVGVGLGELTGIDGLAAYAVVGRGVSERSRFDGDFFFGWRRMLYLGGAEYGIDIGGFFRPFVRATAGVSQQRVWFGAPDAETAEQGRVGFATRNSAGIELHTPYGNRDGSDPAFALADNLTLGVTMEAGYLWQTKAAFDEMQAESTTDEWSNSGVDLGTLDTSGWFWAIGAMLKFRL